MDQLIDQKQFSQIITKSGDINSLQFKTINNELLQEIEQWMPTVNSKVKAFNKKNSQTTTSLMSLNMVDAGPYRVLRQILAQVERKRLALKENMYKLEKKRIQYQKCNRHLQEGHPDFDTLAELKMNKLASDIIDAQGPIEAAIKEIGHLKRQYEAICKNKNISENWSEIDFENAEIEHHIKSIFRNALRDRMQGSHNMGTMEYMEQYGINPITAYVLVDDYIRQIKAAILNNKMININTHYEFYDKMYDLFKDEYKRAIERIGLDDIQNMDFLMKEIV